MPDISCINPFNPYNILLSPFYEWGHWDREVIWPTHKYMCLWMCMYEKEGKRTWYRLFDLPTLHTNNSQRCAWYIYLIFIKYFLPSVLYPLTFPPLLQFLHGTTIIFLKYISDSVPPWFGTFAGSSLFLGTWSIHHSPVLHFHHHSSDLLLHLYFNLFSTLDGHVL